MSADGDQWMIHLAKHRPEIILNLIKLSTSCLLCSFGKFLDDRVAAAHYKYGHNRSDLIKWAYLRIRSNSQDA